MKNAVKEYIEYSDDEKKALWDTATFIFDTNVFLNLYRYSNKTREILIEAFEKLSDRIWMPYQVAYEFCQERYSVIDEANKRFETIDSEVDELVKRWKNQLRLDKEDADVNKLNKYLKQWIEKKKESNYLIFTPNNDPVFLKVLELFDGKTGQAPSEVLRKKIEEEGKKRYENKIPPGYKDDNKVNDNKYGDLFVWKELLSYAKEKGVDIIFVTDDVKEDWWNKSGGKTIGPRIELRKEFYTETEGQKFHMYNMASFIQFFTQDSGNSLDEATIDELKQMAAQKRQRNYIMHGMQEIYEPSSANKEKQIKEINDKIHHLEKKNMKRMQSINSITRKERHGCYISDEERIALIRNHDNMVSDEKQMNSLLMQLSNLTAQ